METILTYLIKVHFLISISYLVYWLLLKNEKFFRLNRIFLLSTMAIVLCLPLMPPLWKPHAEVLRYPVSAFNKINDLYGNAAGETVSRNLDGVVNEVSTATGFQASAIEIFVSVYVIIALAFFIRFLVRLISLFRFIQGLPRSVRHGIRYCEHDENISPFSFFYFMVINRSQFTGVQFEQVCAHEKVHIRQWHTLDLLITEGVHILLWANPVMLLLKRSVKLNLEYLADETVVSSGHDKKIYQLNILQSCLKQTVFPLTNLFSSSKLKLRIKMMNAKKSPATHLYKYALVVTIGLASCFVVQPLGIQTLQAKENDHSGMSNTDPGIFDGLYSFSKDASFVLRITSGVNGLTLTEFWTGDTLFFPASTSLEFLNKEGSFRLRFIKSPDGGIRKLIAFEEDVWNKMETVTQEFKLTEKELQAFAGYYQFEKNQDAYLQFTVKDNGLVAKEVWSGKEYFILPKSALEFYSQKEQYPARFSKDNSGKVTQLLVFNRDVWKKVNEYKPRKEITLSPEKLKAFEGKYTFEFQPGKAEFIQITAKPDHLVLRERWSGNEIKFKPYSDFEFMNDAKNFPLKFTRNSSGGVTHVLAFNRDLWTKVKE